MDEYFQFVAAVLVLLIIPGPDMVYCIACGMSKGVKGAFFAASGIGVGGLILTLVTTLVVYFSDRINPELFLYIQLLGCVYLLYLGITIIIPKAAFSRSVEATKQVYKNIFFRGVVTNIANPKALIFFLTFLPQFVSSDSSNVALSIFTLGLILCVMGVVGNFIFGVSGVSLSGVAKSIYFGRSVEQYVTALIFILVSSLFLSDFLIDLLLVMQ